MVTAVQQCLTSVQTSNFCVMHMKGYMQTLQQHKLDDCQMASLVRNGEVLKPAGLRRQTNWKVGDSCPDEGDKQAVGNALKESWECKREGIKE